MSTVTKKIMVIISFIIIVFIVILLYIYHNKSTDIHKYCTVSFDVDGSNEYISNQKVVKYSKASRPIENPTKEGYVFAGWYMDLGNQEEYNFNNKISSNINLKAKWVEKSNNTYTLVLDYNESKKKEKIKVNFGESIELKTPHREEYEFLGWYLGEERITNTAQLNSDTTLKALWKKYEDKVITYTISFECDDCSIDSQVVKAGEKAKNPGYISKKDYVFLGWYNKDIKFDFDKPVKENITLTSKWEKEKQSNSKTNIEEVKYYKVTFNSDGGSKIVNQEVKELENVQKPNNPIKEGYTFVYWYTDEEEYDFSKPVKSNLILTAKWKKNEEKLDKNNEVNNIELSNKNEELNNDEVSNKNEEKNNDEKVYKINYHIQNAESIEKKTDECVVNSNNYCTVTTPKIIAKSGYAVIGWTANKDSFNIINTNERYSVFSDTDLYAITINLNELNIYVSLNGKDTNNGLTKSYSVATIQKAIDNLNEIARRIGDKTIRSAIIRIDKGTYTNQNAIFNYSKGINIKSIKVMGVRENGVNLTTFIENNSKPNYSPAKFMSINLPSKTINICSSESDLPKCSYGSPVDDSPTFKIWYLNVEKYTNGIMGARLHDSDIAYVYFNQIGNEYTKMGTGYGAIDLTYSNNNTIRYCKFTNVMNGYYYCEKTKTDGSKITTLVDDESKCISTSSIKATLKSAGPFGLHAIYLAYNSNNNKITNSVFTNIKASPIKVRDYSKNNEAKNNTFTNAGYHGYFHISVQTKKTESGQTIITENSATGNVFNNNILKGPYIDNVVCEKYNKYIKKPIIIAKAGDSANVTEENNNLKYNILDGNNACKNLGITIN